MIDVACPQCGVIYHTVETNAGKRILCTKCGYVITIVVAMTSPSPSSLHSKSPVSSSPAVPRVASSGSKKRRTLGIATVAAAVALTALIVVYLWRTNTPVDSGTKADDKWTVAAEESPPRSEASQPPTLEPEPRPTEYNSLPTGTRIEKDTETRGHGELTVENGTTEDAVVRLSDTTTDQTLRWFFVRAHSSAHMTRIPQGTYRLAYTTGLNWVESEDAFSWQPTYNEFERHLDYDEKHDSQGIEYHTIRVTLNAVPFGNVSTRTITREDFLKGHQHMPLEQVN